jgi:hypothetical protein
MSTISHFAQQMAIAQPYASTEDVYDRRVDVLS